MKHFRLNYILLVSLFFIVNLSSAQHIQEKFTPSPALGGYTVNRSYGTVTEQGWYAMFLTYSNDSGLSCLAVANDGTLWKGYDAIPNSGGSLAHHENISAWNTIINWDNGKIYGIGNYHVSGSSNDVSYPFIFRVKPMTGDSTGANMFFQKVFKEIRPGYSTLRNNGGGNDLHFAGSYRKIGVLQNYIPYGKTRPLVRHPFTYNYNMGEDIGFMMMDSAGNRLWDSVYIDSMAGGINQKGTQVGLNYMITSTGEFIIAGLANCTHTPVSGCTNKYDLLLMKLHADGSFAWAKKYHHGRESRGYRVFENSRGRYMVAGLTKEDSANRTKDSALVFLTEFDTSGKVQWAKTYHVWPKKGSPPAGWNTKNFDAMMSWDKSYFAITSDAFPRRGTDSITSVLAVDTAGRFIKAMMYDRFTKNKEFSIATTVENGYAITDFRNSDYHGKALGLKKVDGTMLMWCMEQDTTFAVDTIQWSAPEKIHMVIVSGLDSSTFTVRTANHYVDQSSCGDHDGVSSHFTFHTDHCTCSAIDMKSEVPDDGDFYADERWLGRDTEVYVTDCNEGHHRLRVVNHGIWPNVGDNDTTMFVNLYNGWYVFDIKQNSAVNFTFTLKNPPANLVKYYWNFGDGSALDSTQLQVSHTFTAGKSYDICLRTHRGFPNEYCESVVCRTICLPTDTYNCCNCDDKIARGGH
jgi:hypothetical protein